MTTPGGGTQGSTVSAGAETGGSDLEFVDEVWEGQFALGTQTDLEWSGESLILVDAASIGDHTSRVMTIDEPLEWVGITWIPKAPYGVALPDGGLDDDASYVEGRVDMSDIFAVFHLDAVDPTQSATIVDASGQGNDGVVEGGALQSSMGVHGVALGNLDSTAYVELDPDAIDLDSGFTWSAWFRTDDCSATGGAVILSYDATTNDGVGPSLWAFCGQVAMDCGDGVAFNRLTMNIEGDGEGFILCGTTRLDDDQWHHIAVTKAGTGMVTGTLFVDGEQEDSATGPVGSLSPDGATLFTIGGQPNEPGSYQGRGQYDEVAIWTRPLGNQEIRDLYRRGATRMQFRVRACQTADCSDDPAFAGPAGAGGILADEPDWAPGQVVDLSNLSGVGFQYRVGFERADGLPSPELYEVAVSARRP